VGSELDGAQYLGICSLDVHPLLHEVDEGGEVAPPRRVAKVLLERVVLRVEKTRSALLALSEDAHEAAAAAAAEW